MTALQSIDLPSVLEHIFLNRYKDFVLSICGAESNAPIEETEAQNGLVACPGPHY